MSAFYIGAALCILLALGIVTFPWWRKSHKQAQKTLSNQNVVKQRLNELALEQKQGLLSDDDLSLAEKELKLALLDELPEVREKTTSVGVAMLLGGILALSVGVGVYFYSNQIKLIDQWLVAQEQTSELGQRILQGDESLELQDMQTFALGLRTKLIDTPDDAVGWMLLGRVSGAINRLDSAIQAFEKSLKQDPNNTGTLASYAQALLMTGQELQVLQAKRALLHILSLEPDNTNAMGVLAITASELGDKSLALENWQRLLAFIPNTDPNYNAVNQRIAELKMELAVPQDAKTASAQQDKAESTTVDEVTRVSVTVKVADELISQLPSAGFLFVFAQEASGKVRMPAAVVKMPLGEFPVVVELSNANAMMPNYTLSQLQEARLVARVSIDENVAQSPGEFQGEWLATLSMGNPTQETITIDRVL